MNTDKITFTIQLSLYDVYDMNGYCITHKYININKDSECIKLWLKNDVNLSDYYDLFMEHGFQNMDDVLTLDMEQLNLFGIKDINHKIKILHDIDKKKQKQQH